MDEASFLRVGGEWMAVDLVDYHVVKSPRRQEEAGWGFELKDKSDN